MFIRSLFQALRKVNPQHSKQQGTEQVQRRRSRGGGPPLRLQHTDDFQQPILEDGSEHFDTEQEVYHNLQTQHQLSSIFLALLVSVIANNSIYV